MYWEGTFAVLSKQWMTKGCAADLMLSGTGDGGSENQGCEGVHALLTEKNPSYRPGRCLPHLDWTGCKAGEDAMGLHHKHLKALNTYLFDGITYSRLQALATASAADGGLALMRDGSRAFKTLFVPMPPKMIDLRPEDTMEFLRWLIPREKVLAKLVQRDCETRDLSRTSANLGRDTLQKRSDALKRPIDAVLLHRCLHISVRKLVPRSVNTDRSKNASGYMCSSIISCRLPWSRCAGACTPSS